jgi:ABC-type sugar transport system substrate-binding protein
MKNWLILLIITVLMVSMSSLAFGQEKPAEGMYFRLVTHGGDDPFWAVVQQGMLDAAKELGCQVDIDIRFFIINWLWNLSFFVFHNR